ncbi:porin family protein [Pontibacter russatus]|uniref:porin family protein n=1 Tax=Pontibacter russatus TaxID=2694929 RepID=UPI001379CB9F|nr:porin family protein [Pontibacter russatus]
MRKLYLLPLLLLCSLAASAQTEGPSTIRQDHNAYSGLDAPNAGIGFKAGVNFANLHGSDKDLLGAVSGHTDFHAGIFAQIAVGEVFSVQPELLYSRKGYARNDSTFRLHYFDVPVLAVCRISDNFSVHLGPQVGFMIAANEGGAEVDLQPYNIFGYGAAAGLEGRVSHFRVGARYVHSFEQLRNANQEGEPIAQDIGNSVVQVYIGIAI